MGSYWYYTIMKQKYIKAHNGHAVGDIVELDHSTFIKLGITEPVKEEKRTATENTDKKNAAL